MSGVSTKQISVRTDSHAGGKVAHVAIDNQRKLNTMNSALMDEFAAMSPAMKRKVERECKSFYFKHSPLEKTGSRRHYAERVVDNWGMRRTISKIQGLCFASPLYGIYRNPDANDRLGEATWGGKLPVRLPLLAFDTQAPEAPLCLASLPFVPGWGKLQAEIERHPEWIAPTVLPEGYLRPDVDEDEHLDLVEAGVTPK